MSGHNADETITPTSAPNLPIPNVQEMVSKDPLQVPQRYVRSEEEMEKVKYMPYLSSEIPVIDLSLLSNGNNEELLKQNVACKDWGFFQLVNHGVPKEVKKRMKDAAADFFKLPIEEKDKCAMPSNDIQGYGHAYVVSEEQMLDWSDKLVLVVYPTQNRKLQFWPNTPEGFKEIIVAYSSEVRRIAEELLSCLSMILGMEKHVLLGLHEELGQALQIWSNGKYKSAEHRIMTNKNKGRFSYASFLVPHHDVEVESLDHVIEPFMLKMYKKVKYGDYLKQYLEKKLERKAHIDVAKIEA